MSTPGGAVTWLALAAALGLGLGPTSAGGSARLRALVVAGRVNRGRAPEGRRAALLALAPRAAVTVAVLAVAALGGFAGPALAAAAAVVALTAGVLVGDTAARRTAVRRRRQLLAALRLLVGELAAGARPGAALSAAAAVGGARYAPVLENAAASAAAGADAATVLTADADTRAVGLAWRLGAETGAGLEAVLARVADDLAASDEQARAVAVALAGPRSSATVLAGLPVLGLGLGVTMGARPLAFLTGSPGGRTVAAVGVFLDAAGLLWMRSIMRRAERP